MPPIPIVIAHRGASGYRPEHTRAAYEVGIAQGADAVEPDIVPTRDGVLVVRHENEISGTTDVASHPEFAARRVLKIIDGKPITGWFTEDFTWAELSTLRARERLPKVRPTSAAFDGTEPILRLRDVRELVDAAGITMVAELKHARYFASVGLPLDELFANEMRDWSANGRLVVESFEQGVLMAVRDRGVQGDLVFLAEGHGHPADTKRSYADHLSDAGLARLADEVDGVSPDVALVLGPDDLVARAHDAGLSVFTWTLRAEKKFVPRAYRGDYAAYFGAVMAQGVEGVFADQPDLALAVRAARAPS
ncbi:glycerophosphodiester phosphodiesterase [soil metagenome]